MWNEGAFDAWGEDEEEEEVPADVGKDYTWGWGAYDANEITQPSLIRERYEESPPASIPVYRRQPGGAIESLGHSLDIENLTQHQLGQLVKRMSQPGHTEDDFIY